MVPRLDLECQKCEHSAFHYCVICETRDLQATEGFPFWNEIVQTAMEVRACALPSGS